MQNHIKELRASLGFTQEQLAQAVDVRRETIVFLEQGKYEPSLGLAYRVAKKLGKKIEEVFEF
jgi:putative transcriptional regulator